MVPVCFHLYPLKVVREVKKCLPRRCSHSPIKRPIYAVLGSSFLSFRLAMTLPFVIVIYHDIPLQYAYYCIHCLIFHCKTPLGVQICTIWSHTVAFTFDFSLLYRYCCHSSADFSRIRITFHHGHTHCTTYSLGERKAKTLN